MSQEFTTYRSVFDKSEYIKQGQIITYDNLNSVDDLPELSTLERQDIYHARTGFLSSDYIAPVDTDGSGSFDEWRSLVDGKNIDIPDSVVEDFERDDPLDDYDGDFSNYSIDDQNPLVGSKSLISSEGSSPSVIIWDDHPNAPSQGDTFSALIEPRESTTNGRFIWAVSGPQDSYDGYEILLGTSIDNVWIQKAEDGNISTLAEGDISSISQDQTYEPVVTWESDGTIDVDVYEFDTSDMTRGDHVGSVSDTDTDYSSGGIGWGGSGDSTDVAMDWYVIGPGDGDY